MECEKPTGQSPNGRTGTMAGCQAHRKKGEPVCDPCKEAERRYEEKRKGRTGNETMECQKPTRKFPGGRTGTSAGYVAHRKEKEEPCKACKEAELKRAKERKPRGDEECHTPTKKFPEGRTGTYAGSAFHKKVGEEPCEPCREAGQAYSRQAYQKYYRKHREDILVKNMRRKAQERDWRHIPYTAKQITETFGTDCYLCEHPIDLQLESGKPLSASIDHVVPLHLTDGPGDQLSNVRWTHLRCNLRKRHRTVGQCALPFPKPRGDEF